MMLFNLPQPMGLAAVHPARQPAGKAIVNCIKQPVAVGAFQITFLEDYPVHSAVVCLCVGNF